MLGWHQEKLEVPSPHFSCMVQLQEPHTPNPSREISPSSAQG